MKKTYILVLLVVLTLIMLAACGKSKPSLTSAQMMENGEKYLADRDFERAKVYFEMLAEFEPTNSRGYTGAAEAYASLGETDRAIAILDKGSRELPDDTEIRSKLTTLEAAAQQQKPSPKPDPSPDPSVPPSAAPSPAPSADPPATGTASASPDEPSTSPAALKVQIWYGERKWKLEDFSAKISEKTPVWVEISPFGTQIDEVIWKSSNTKVFDVITVSEDGRYAQVIGVGKGNATLTVTVGEATDDCIVRIRG